MTPYERVIFKGVRDANGCLIYRGKRRPDGYGIVSVAGNRDIRATRVVAEHHYGPSDLNVLHACDNPSCIEPTHLRYGTVGENSADARERGQQPRGERHGMARLTEADARAVLLDDRPTRVVAESFGISSGHVNDIRAGRRWAHLFAGIRMRPRA